MKHPFGTKRTHRRILLVSLVVGLLLPSVALAATPSAQNPQSGSTGVQGEISGPPPKTAPTIAIPSNGQVFTTVPITVSGLCSGKLLVKVFDNGVFVGAAVCQNGSYSLKSDLFSGRNDLVAKQYDALDQSSPASNTVTVTFDDAQFTQFGTHVALTSDYARRGANPGQTLTWPVTVSSGVGPYAISVDWGDGKAADLISQPYPATINLQHVYATAGTYDIIVKATDKNGTTAYLQLVGVANGSASQLGSSSNNGNKSPTTKTVVLWWPAAVLLVLAVVSFWLGRRYELASLRKRMENRS
ncbi:MAG TPA: hypothetical protein VGG13_02095 [Candidatus Saccharimonadales bacterium]|jgi:hypothetical protein